MIWESHDSYKSHPALGIETGADLKTKPLAFLQPHFGKPGLWYYKIARGLDERFVEPGRPRKSVGAEDTFTSDTFELDAAVQNWDRLSPRSGIIVRPRAFVAGPVTLKVKFADFQQITRSRTAEFPMHALADVEQLAASLLNPFSPRRRDPIARCHPFIAFEAPPSEQHQLRLEF
ncbi:hypothetical protein CK228_34505 [Mesorhizobium sp. WSM4312]|uniref:DinB/UmuC family translesion DNA polymerase n=1 Tax=Mesorhizobium sp. WSM4312 TaxID=2029411 RepID=UPI000BAF0433|nr:hypothetical protein [Mesorhizobium sp. WSM4312]PBB64192.1 hypothetical protein CK228_34505 [Mesorhizobium sp. WSM4312]